MSKDDANSVLEFRAFLESIPEEFEKGLAFLRECRGIRASAKSLASDHLQNCIVRVKKALRNLNDEFDNAEKEMSKSFIPDESAVA